MNHNHLHMLQRARAQARKLINPSPTPQHNGYSTPPAVTVGQDAMVNNHPAGTELEVRHQESVRRYPQLGLSKEEYVILEAQRHPIGLISIWLVVLMVLLLTFVALPVYAANRDNLAEALNVSASAFPQAALVAIPLFIASGLFVLGGFLATKVYLGNRFYLTNESVIQQVQKSLFNVKNQAISLVNVEDASYEKRGILQHLFDYGDLRLSTQGEDTTYHFYTVGNPARIAHAVNDATEAAIRAIESAQEESK